MNQRDTQELLALARAAFEGKKSDECDTCTRYPDSGADGIRLCSLCELGEFLNDGDIGRLGEDLMVLGLATR